MILGYLFSWSLTFSRQSASNIRGKTDKDKGDHDIGIPVLLSLIFSTQSANNIRSKTDKDKGNHDTGIHVFFFVNFLFGLYLLYSA
jgi:hypothetical protein